VPVVYAYLDRFAGRLRGHEKHGRSEVVAPATES
jgi:hypothetical protein